MKKIISTSFAFFVFFHLSAQQNINDSLRRLLIVAQEDTAKVKLLNQIAGRFVESRPDSNLFYANQALDLSRKISYTKGEIAALLNTTAGFTLSGNYAKALENSLMALKKSEDIHNDRLLAHSFFTIGYIYSVQEDRRMAIPYQLKATEVYEKLHDTLNVANNLINTGVSYRELNEFDSANRSFNKSFELSLLLKNEENISAIYLNLGIISLKTRQNDLGISYCRLALPYFKAVNSHLFLSSIYNVLGDLFDSTGRRDSAFYYSRLAYYHAKEMGSPQLLLFATKQLSLLFKESKQPDSAFIYYETGDSWVQCPIYGCASKTKRESGGGTKEKPGAGRHCHFYTRVFIHSITSGEKKSKIQNYRISRGACLTFSF